MHLIRIRSIWVGFGLPVGAAEIKKHTKLKREN